MKKFSTALLLNLLLTSFLPMHLAWSSNVCEWAANAPEKYHVRTGDTLWDIASVFLSNPWCWPSVWKPNQDRIQNPHWIYPDQVIVLNRLNGTLQLQPNNEEPARHLVPTIRSTTMRGSQVPMLSKPLESLLLRTPLISSSHLPDIATISTIENDHVIAGKGDFILAKGHLGNNERFDVFRIDQVIVDPDTRLPLGVAGLNIGRAQVHQRGDTVHRLKVTRSDREFRVGDKLLPASDLSDTPMFPHPAKITDGKLAAILHEGRWARLHDIVVINRGAIHGLDPGSVVHVVPRVRINPNEDSSVPQRLNAKPSIGTLLVFKVQEKISLAMIMQARDVITEGDSITSPEVDEP